MSTEIDATKEEIDAIQTRIMADKERLTELRRGLPQRLVKDYELSELGGAVALSSLFEEKDDLILIHNMGAGCPYCTLWADGLNGLLGHMQNRAGVALMSPNTPEKQAEFAASRGWNFRMVSAAGSTINADLQMVGSDGESAYPGVSTFKRSADGTINLVGQSYFGPGDDFCAVWPLFDLLADGSNGWEPQYKY